MLIKDTEVWANNLFEHANFSDKCRTKHLVKISHLMAVIREVQLLRNQTIKPQLKALIAFLETMKLKLMMLSCVG